MQSAERGERGKGTTGTQLKLEPEIENTLDEEMPSVPRLVSEALTSTVKQLAIQ